MKTESAKGNYELAAEARDQLFGLKELKKKIVFSDKEFLDISSDKALKQLQDMLELDKPPRRIEGYDISHQSGFDTVGSMVVFINGAAARNEYRKFKIRSSANNDLKSMQEVIERRLKHREWDYPDLIVLDGGESQVGAIMPLLESRKIPVIGRNKSGNHANSAGIQLVIPDGNSKYNTIRLSSSSHVARLIARVDEESHRFAITYHTLLKRKRLFK